MRPPRPRAIYWTLNGVVPEPCEDVMRWGKAFEAVDSRRVAQTYLSGDEVWVSTVFLGIDHNYAPKGPPLLFETMCFAPPELRTLRTNKEYQYVARPELDCVRTSTWWEALIEHGRAVANMRRLIEENDAMLTETFERAMKQEPR